MHGSTGLKSQRWRAPTLGPISINLKRESSFSSRVNVNTYLRNLPFSLIIDALVSTEIRGAEFAIGSREKHSISRGSPIRFSRVNIPFRRTSSRWTAGTRLIRFRRNAAYHRPRHTCASTCYHTSSGMQNVKLDCQERKSNICVSLFQKFVDQCS